MAALVPASVDLGRHPDGSASNGAYQERMKKQKLGFEERPTDPDLPTSLPVSFVTVEGKTIGPRLDLPINASVTKLEKLVNELLVMELPKGTKAGDDVPYAFYINDKEMIGTIGQVVTEMGLSTETTLTITCQPLAVFRVRPVTRCGETMPGHSDAVLHVSYSPDGNRLASGSGDTTVRFWDTASCTPKHTCRGHKHHVLCTAWSPDGLRFASSDKTGVIMLWDPVTGAAVGAPLRGHKQWVTSLCWEPMHRNNGLCERLASASKDCTIKVWNVRTHLCLFSLSGHTDSVEALKWGGAGFLYSASRDRTIKVWGVDDAGAGKEAGKLVRTLSGHGHRVNSLALNCEYVCRTGPYDRAAGSLGPFASVEVACAASKERYDKCLGGGVATGTGKELLVSGSDDFSLFLWAPTEGKQPLQRLVGHQQAVNDLAFSPDGRYLASASFDKKVKVWDGRTGAFVATLTGHVGAVYKVAWSMDSRLLCSASKDSTIKLWDTADLKTAKYTLPGHADEVYALDWSPNGTQLASGSKDRTIKIWRN